ncbi:hypothetical protein HPB52_008776 [Rhipicephalus sanguineus]|uniref:DDE Tnp4 domain-containing protein n=1 Tax=Rhipicephalus sanguineus TaxID=34632 RepID=A0A9D4PI28_RHISA|nr:hypothetical protein HPB52_008776 [Rhipicephalus sanguineus]
MVRSSILWDPYCLAYLSWEDIEALMLREKEPPRRRVYASRGGLLNLDSMSSHCFRRQFRFEKADFPVLVRALKMPRYITSAQGVRVTATEALCICLRRLAYPNRLCDLQEYFGRHYSVVSSVSNKVLYHIEKNFGCLLSNMTIHPWLKHSDLEAMSEAVHRKGAPLSNCWAFIDGTARPICRPSQDQRLYFSVHRRLHVLKYQSLMCPNGLICQLDGPYPGRRHDAGILRDSQLYEKLEALTLDKEFVIYGDPAYPLRPLLMKPYGGAALTATQQAFNSSMSAPPCLQDYLSPASH